MNHHIPFLHRLLGIDIVKVFSLNALSTTVRMLAGMISVKVIAVIIGPSGIAILGQLSNFSTILLGMANGGISNGITKFVAEYKDNETEIKKYISNALHITLICSLLSAIILIVFSRQLSHLILLEEDFFYVFVVFGITILLFTLNTLIISILNGYKEFKHYVKVNIIGTIFGLLYSTFLVVIWGLPGALINAVTFQSIMLFVTFWMCRKMPWMKREFFIQKINKIVISKYFGYSLMTLTTLALVPTSQIFLRGYVISELSATDAGIWEGLNRISGMYLSVITSAFSIYYLPRMSEISNIKELHIELIRCYKVIVPMLLGISITIFFFKHIILWLLFTPEFYPMEKLFVWQLAGDIIKLSSWLLSYMMVAKARTVMYISTEILYTIAYLAISFVLLRINGIVGLTQGYLLSYCIYFISMIILFRRVIFVKS